MKAFRPTIPLVASERLDGGHRRGIGKWDVLSLLIAAALLLSLSMPWLLSLREKSRARTCQNRLRHLTSALQAYHDVHGVFPPAARWSTEVTQSLALHNSKWVERITQENWAILLLPYLDVGNAVAVPDRSLSIGDDRYTRLRTTSLPQMTCPADQYNRADNHYALTHGGEHSAAIQFARGNYAINGGSHNHDLQPPTTAHPRGEQATLVMDPLERRYELWGNGIAGINKSFSRDNFQNGQSTLVAFEEVRAGLHPADPRGVWALGQIGGSITWSHGINSDAAGPNNPWERSDDIMGCQKLHQVLGGQKLAEENMPCVSYIDLNQQATSRSTHPGGVFVAFVDGSVRFISDDIAPDVWHVLHSRRTPKDRLQNVWDESRPPAAAGLNEQPSTATNNQPTPQPEPDAASEDSVLPNSSPWTNTLDMEFVQLPAGEFTMGIPDLHNAGDLPPECPPHQVQLTRPIWMASREVTRAQLSECLKTVPVNEVADTKNLPATGVTWEDALTFCRELSLRPKEQAAGRTYRLPTEAEWEYACRAGKSEPYSFRAVRKPEDGSGDAAGINPPIPLLPVGSFPANEFGLHDMRGNAWEWTQDWYARDYYANSPLKDPQGPESGYLKVVRGSDWRFVGEPCYIDYPMLPPWEANPLVGFRVVCECATPASNEQ